MGNLVPVFAELPADLDTPLSAWLRLRPGPYAFLLESVEGGEVWARYSFLGADPLMVLTSKNGRIRLRRAGSRNDERLPDGNPLDAIRTLLRDFQPVALPDLPRFQGGAVGYLAYDMVRHMERIPAAARDDLGLPDAVFMFSDTLLVFDNLKHRLLVIANAHIRRTDDAGLDQAYDAAAVKIGMTLRQLGRPARPPVPLALAAPAPLVALGEEGFTQRSTLLPVTPSRSCSHAASTALVRLTRSRSTVPSARSIRRRTCSTFGSGRRRSWGRLRRCSCASRVIASS
jgi:anthranilate synthase component 1